MNQPLFVVKISDQVHYLPPEFCLVDGVSDSMKKSQAMRFALQKTHISPKEKMDKVEGMASKLMGQKALKNWDISIEKAPIEICSRVMTAP